MPLQKVEVMHDTIHKNNSATVEVSGVIYVLQFNHNNMQAGSHLYLVDRCKNENAIPQCQPYSVLTRLSIGQFSHAYGIEDGGSYLMSRHLLCLLLNVEWERADL